MTCFVVRHYYLNIFSTCTLCIVYVKRRILVASATALCSSSFSRLKKTLQQTVKRNLLVMGCYVMQLLVFITLNNKPVGRIFCTVHYVVRNFRANCLFGFFSLQIKGVRSSCTLVSVTGRLPCLVSHMRGGADKSLVRPTSRCRRTESIVSLERDVFSYAELEVFSCYRC